MHIQLKTRQIPVTIRKSQRAKHLRAAFSRDYAQIVVTQPHRCTKRVLESFVKEQVEPWARKNDKYAGAINLLEQDQLRLFDRTVTIRRTQDIRDGYGIFPTLAEPEFIKIYHLRPEVAGQLLQQAIFKMARHQFKSWCDDYAAQLGVTYNRLSVRDTTSRWGSCSKTNKSINLSVRLAFAPVEVAKYVCAHEISHLIQANHSQEFWQLVETLDANYTKHRKWLRNNTQVLHSYNLLG